MRPGRVAVAAAALLLLPVLAACGSGASSGSTSSNAPAATGGPGLVGSWSLVGASVDSSDLSTFGITLTLTDTTASGFAGVNQYTTTFTSGPDGTFDFGPIASTKMAGPEAAMQAEQAYLALLDTVTGYTVSGGELDLFADEQQVLTYAK